MSARSRRTEAAPKQHMASDINWLKVRGDGASVYFSQNADEQPECEYSKVFAIAAGTQCNWLKKQTDGEYQIFTPVELRKQIEPWLTALFQSDHLSLLVGSGITQAIHLLACHCTAPLININIPSYKDAITQGEKNSAMESGRGDEPNFEDTLRVANEIYSGFKHFMPLESTTTDAKKTIESLKAEIENALSSISQTVLQGEANIATAIDNDREKAFNYLVGFLMSFASRAGTRDRLHVFTTNYDRIIEAGAEIAGLHLIDRFVGSLNPIFRSSRLNLDMHYNPPGIRGEPRYLEGVVRYTKLHGSLDWVSIGNEIRRLGLPFGSKNVEPYLDAPGLRGAKFHELMIYPNAAKDQETALFPYVELFRDFAAATCRPNNTLVTYGYSFGDSHINRIIADMLTIPSTHLVIIAYSDLGDRIKHFCERLGRWPQISVLIGPDLGNIQELVDSYLPKAAIDRTTIKMSDLLKARYSPEVNVVSADEAVELTTTGGENDNLQ